MTPLTGFDTLSLPANGYRFDAIARGEPRAPLVLFLHGWPSFAASWREIMAPVAAAGFRAVAVDQRGYSRGARPPGQRHPAKAERFAIYSMSNRQLRARRNNPAAATGGAGFATWNTADRQASRELDCFAALATTELREDDRHHSASADFESLTFGATGQ